MHRSETYDQVPCADCGGEISLSRDRAYNFGQEDALCFECALSRGGRYNALHDCWEEAPQLEGLHVAPPG